MCELIVIPGLALRHSHTIQCRAFEYSGPVPCAGELQKCIDSAYWTLLAGMHDIDEGHPDLNYKRVLEATMKVLAKYQLGVG